MIDTTSVRTFLSRKINSFLIPHDTDGNDKSNGNIDSNSETSGNGREIAF